jgi:DinB superfamily
MLNPYASFLNGGNPLDVIAATPARLATLAAAPSRTPPPGKWDIREVVCHLADCEIAFGFRLRQALAEPHHTIQPFDQDAWAASYAAYDLAGALEAFGALRRWNVKFIAGQPSEAFERQITHPERGTMTFRTLVETMAGHDLNHVRQIEALAD